MEDFDHKRDAAEGVGGCIFQCWLQGQEQATKMMLDTRQEYTDVVVQHAYCQRKTKSKSKSKSKDGRVFCFISNTMLMTLGGRDVGVRWVVGEGREA